MSLYDFTIFMIKLIFIVAIVLSLIMGVIIPLIQNLSRNTEQPKIESSVTPRRPRPFLPSYLEEEEIEIPTNYKSQADENKEILKLAKNDPAKTAMLVRNWINEKK